MTPKPAKKPPTPKQEFETANEALKKLRTKKSGAVGDAMRPSGGQPLFGDGQKGPSATAASSIELPPPPKEEPPQPSLDIESILELKLVKDRNRLLIWGVGVLIALLLAASSWMRSTETDLRSETRSLRTESAARIERLESRIEALDSRLRELEKETGPRSQ
jgi:hypothetical protein